MDKVAKVIDIQNDKAILEVKRMSECGDKCSACAGACETPTMRVEVRNTQNAQKGDLVVLKMEPASLVQTTFILYTIPLLLFVAGIFAGILAAGQMEIQQAEVVGILTGCIGLVIGFVFVGKWSKGQERSGKDIIVMDRVMKHL